MRGFRCSALLLAVVALALFPLACSKSSSGHSVPPTAALLSGAEYFDINGDGALNAGDTLVVRFSGPVGVSGAPRANTIFVLSGAGVNLGAAVVVLGPASNEVTIPLDAAVSFQPNGDFNTDPGSTGLNVDSTQQGVTQFATGSYVPAAVTPVDIEGELNPVILSAVYIDDGDCQAGTGDTVVVTFSTNVDILTNSPGQAFQVLPSTLNPFGVNPTFLGGQPTGASVITIEVDANPTLMVNGTFDPVAPLAGPTGIDVGTTLNQIVDSSFPLVAAVAATPPGFDITGNLVVAMTGASYTDLGTAGLDAGDEVQIDFCSPVDILDPAAAPNTAFQLLVAGDSFGTGATFSAPLPIVGASFIIIQLGTAPVLNINGLYDPMVVAAGSPSGIDVTPLGQVAQTGGGMALMPLSPPGIDIAGGAFAGTWSTLPNPMNQERTGHTATLLTNGEILIVGGQWDADSPTNPGFRQSLDSIEIFDPATETFTDVTWDSLVRPRAFHYAVLTPGLDNLVGTDDEYVVIIGGWNSESSDNGGPHSEGSVEVIVPDPNGDGMTDDLVVNPLPGWMPPGTATPAGAVLDEMSPMTFQGIGPGSSDASIPPGMQLSSYDWAPDVYFAASAGITTGLGNGNNEILGIGGFMTWVWDAAGGGESFWYIFYFDPVTCNDGRPWVAIDADEDGDFWDNDVPNDLYDGIFLGAIGSTANPWATPSLARTFETQTRIPGADTLLGTMDDTLVVYGGDGFDLTTYCQGAPLAPCLLADLELFGPFGPVYVGINDSWSVCGLYCTAPGSGQTDRLAHAAAPGGNPANSVVILGGMYSNFGSVGGECGQAVEIITPDFVDPMLSTITYGGLDDLTTRGWYANAATLEVSGSVLVSGGIRVDPDPAIDGTTDSCVLVGVPGGSVATTPPMSQPRDLHAGVSYPASLGVFLQDRVYIFGGWDRTGTNLYFVRDSAATLAGTTTNSAEYFME